MAFRAEIRLLMRAKTERHSFGDRADDRGLGRSGAQETARLLQPTPAVVRMKSRFLETAERIRADLTVL